MSADDRRRQLLSIGLTKLMDKPIQDLSLDEVATEAGISRGLLFHYFPTKTDYYIACIEAAGRRIRRNTAPQDADPPEQQLATMVRLMIEQIDRRRAFFLSLVHGGHDTRVTDVFASVRSTNTERVLATLGLPETARDIVHAWWAYVEDRALTWSARPTADRDTDIAVLTDQCCALLPAALA